MLICTYNNTDDVSECTGWRRVNSICVKRCTYNNTDDVSEMYV